MKNKYITIALVAVALLGVGGLAWFTNGGNKLTEPSATNDPVPSTQEGVVASFNDGNATITRDQLTAHMQTVASSLQMQIPSETDPQARSEFERLILKQMIDGILLFNEAEKQGFTADDATIETELATIVGQYENTAAFEAALTAAQLDKETLRENIRHQLITNQYYAKLAMEQNLTVSPEEIRTFFDTQVAPQNATVVFEDEEANIRKYLEQQKMQQILDPIIEELQKTANVQILI